MCLAILGARIVGWSNDKTQTHHNIEKEGKELEIAKETQKLNWLVTTSENTLR